MQSVDRVQSTPYELFLSNSVIVENNSTLTQEGHTTQRTEQETTSFEWSLAESIQVKATQKFNWFTIGETAIEITVGMNFGQKWTNSTMTSITYPSQKVVAPPKTRVIMTYYVYKARFTTNYLSNFTMDPKQDLIKNCIKILTPNQIKNSTLELYPEVGITKAIFTTSQQILINMPTVVVSDGFEVRIHISDPEPLSVPMNDTTIRRINILHLNSTKFN